MSNHEKLQLRNQSETPTDEVLKLALGPSYAAYETFHDVLADLEIEQEWQWYGPYKAWFAKGRCFWTTPRGAKKEKTLYWLYVYDEYFVVGVWVKEKNRSKVLNAEVSEEIKQLVQTSKANGKLTTFPVLFPIISFEQLPALFELINYKIKIEV